MQLEPGSTGQARGRPYCTSRSHKSVHELARGGYLDSDGDLNVRNPRRWSQIDVNGRISNDIKCALMWMHITSQIWPIANVMNLYTCKKREVPGSKRER